uniref:Uncharacterized protein n=1 Tax=Physcomitrium patens TaxID=3218 RepID=A0A7I4CIG7_PHYPA
MVLSGHTAEQELHLFVAIGNRRSVLQEHIRQGSTTIVLAKVMTLESGCYCEDRKTSRQPFVHEYYILYAFTGTMHQSS